MEVMTLDEAIKHAEEVAEENREYAEDALDRYNLVPNEITKQEHDRCKQCASEHQQLAEWLKDYKRLMERECCEDAISRQAAIDALDKRFDNIPMEQTTEILQLRRDLRQLPSAQPERKAKTGHWISDDECKEHGHCSYCGYGSVDLVDGEPHNFCSNWGAKMVESEE